MTRAQGYDGGYFILESGGGVTPISKRSFDVINQQNNEITKKEKQLQQYKSLVKTVDADNLPAGEVLAIDSTKEVMSSNCLWADAFGTVWAENDIENMNVITHYIEQKDLLKLISGE